MLEPPTSPSWNRWWRLGRPDRSFLRDLEHELLRSVRLSGRCLDLGGGRGTSYSKLVELSGSIESLNISAVSGPDIIADLNRPLPIADAVYDAVICFNTLEHIEEDQLALRELFRVLRPGGQFHLLVPFLYRVHGSPSDFHRHTCFEWERRLENLGLYRGDFRIRPLVWDVVSTAWAMIEVALPRLRWLRWVLRPVSLLPGLLYYKVRRRPDAWSNFALAYYITGVKTDNGLS